MLREPCFCQFIEYFFPFYSSLFLFTHFTFNMLSVSVFRNAAVMSARRTTIKIGSSVAPMRLYTTEGEKKDEPKKEEAAPKVEVELTEEVKKMLAEKDKQIAEIKVKCI